MTKFTPLLIAAALPLALAAPAFACDGAKKSAQSDTAVVTYMAMAPMAVASADTPPEQSDMTDKDTDDTKADADVDADPQDALITTPNSDVAGEVEMFEPGYGEGAVEDYEIRDTDEITADDAEADWSAGEGETMESDTDETAEDEAEEPLD